MVGWELTRFCFVVVSIGMVRRLMNVVKAIDFVRGPLFDVNPVYLVPHQQRTNASLGRMTNSQGSMQRYKYKTVAGYHLIVKTVQRSQTRPSLCSRTRLSASTGLDLPLTTQRLRIAEQVMRIHLHLDIL